MFILSGDGGYARDARLKAPSSLAVAPNGTLYIADLGNIRIRAVSPNQPQPSPAGLVEISSPQDQELYLFSQVGSAEARLCKQSSAALNITWRLKNCVLVERSQYEYAVLGSGVEVFTSVRKCKQHETIHTFTHICKFELIYFPTNSPPIMYLQ